jgi:hypothetical protein
MIYVWVEKECKVVEVLLANANMDNLKMMKDNVKIVISLVVNVMECGLMIAKHVKVIRDKSS